MTITPFGESWFNEKAKFFRGLDAETIQSGKVIVDGSKDNSISGVSTFSGTSILVDNGYLSSLNVSGVSTFNGDSIFTSKTQNLLGSPDTGAIQIVGGVGIEKNVSIGNSLDVSGNISQNKNIIRGFHSYAILRDVKDATTDGGDSFSTTWNNRIFTEEIDPDGIVNAAGITVGRFRLEKGSYLILWATTGYRCRRFASRLDDITNNIVFPGTSMYLDDQDSAANTIGAGGESSGVARFTLTTHAFFRLYSYSEFAQATNGLGIAHDSAGFDNVYSHLTIFKDLNVAT